MSKTINGFSRFYSTMPECSFTPKLYTGWSTKKVLEKKREFVTPSMSAYYSEPLNLHQGYKQWLWDSDGKRYLDMFAGIVTVGIGHCHPAVVEAAAEQMSTLGHISPLYVNSKMVEYADQLTATLPAELKVCYFVNSGSEANDLAMMMMELHTKSPFIIGLRNGYHGGGPYCAGLTANHNFRFPISSRASIHQTMNPDVYRGVWGGRKCRDSVVQADRQCGCQTGQCLASDMYLSQLDDVLKSTCSKGRVGGFFAETIQGVGGVVQYPKTFMKKAYDLIRNWGGLCLADEVQTGFGRTGEHFWGFQMHDVIPDIVTMAKSIGNGFPMAAVVTTKNIANSLSQALHINTFGGNPLACTVGSAVLNVIKEERLQENALTVGTHLLRKLANFRDMFKIVGDVRGKGLMIGVELVTDKVTKEPLAANKMAKILDVTKENGVLIGKGGLHGNVIRIKPPMCITLEDADFCVHVLQNALEAVEQGQ